MRADGAGSDSKTKRRRLSSSTWWTSVRADRRSSAETCRASSSGYPERDPLSGGPVARGVGRGQDGAVFPGLQRTAPDPPAEAQYVGTGGAVADELPDLAPSSDDLDDDDRLLAERIPQARPADHGR